MNQNFEEKVMEKGQVDTAKYRYAYIGEDHMYRIPLSMIDKHLPYSKWETVKMSFKRWADCKGKRFRIQHDYLDSWGCYSDSDDDSIVDFDTIRSLAYEWGRPIDELLDQCDEI